MHKPTYFCVVTIAVLIQLNDARANEVVDVQLIPIQSHSALIDVYSTNGEAWTNVDRSKASTFRADHISKCKYTGTLSGKNAEQGALKVTGFKRISGGTTTQAYGTITGQYQYEGNGNINPVQVCNDELQKRLATSNDLTKYHLLAEGFNVRYEGAFSAIYGLTCKPTGLGFEDYDGASAHLNATMRCLGSAKAKAKIPQEPMKVAKAQVVPVIRSVSFEADPKLYSGKCPVGVRFKGTIVANRAGDVKYRYDSNDGKQSAVYTLRFDRAGTKQTGNWMRTISEPEPNPNSISAGGQGNRTYKGWQRLIILSPEGPSRQANFSVTCRKAPTRATIKTN